MDEAHAYRTTLARAGRAAAPALARRLGIGRGAAADAFGATAGLVLAGLARHQGRRRDAGAASAVIEKYGRPADVEAPGLAVEANLASPQLDARLGGLLGDASDRAARWLAERTGERPDALARALAASAPLALGALHATSLERLPSLLADVTPGALDAPGTLESSPDSCGRAYRSVRRGSRPLWMRLLGR